MNEKQYKDLKETFPYVEKLSAKARHAYFERLYPDDPTLRKEAAALFETHENEMASRAFRDLSSSQGVSNQKEDTDFVDIDFDGFRKYKFGPEDLLGRGGMGVVFKALDIDLDRYVAIKLLPTNLADDPERKKRFEVEARTLVNLSHPYILKVFDFGQAEDGSFYMVSELVEGRPLNEFIKTGGTNLKEKLYIARYVGEAISAGHKQGVIHRDIKPNNILLRKDGYPVVLDFGLAKLLENHDFRNIPDSRVVTSPLVVTDRRMIVGTPAYMSPEQASQRKLDERTDIFSFGILLYELFTGKHPFTGLTDFEINAAIQKDEPLPIENDHIPDDLQAVIKKAIRKDLSKRYQSMEHLLEDLRSIGETEDTLRLFMPESDEDPRIPDTDPQADGPTAEDATVQTERGSLWKTVTAKNVVRKLRAHTWLMVLVLAAVTSIVAGAYYLTSRTFEPTPAALAWYEKGREAFKHGDFLSAKTNFEKAVETDRNYALAQMSLAETLNETGDFEGAKSARQVAIDKNQQAELPLDQGDSVRFEAISKTIQRDFPGALRAYETMAGNAIGPDKAEAQLHLGRAYESEFLLDDALRSYKTAISIDKEMPYPPLLLADIYARRMETKTALQNYDASADLYRKRQNLQGEIEAIFRRGLLYQKLGREKDAIEDLQEANQKALKAGLSFQTGRTFYLLARIARGSRQLDDALRYLD
ncbi:MAG: protein kinase, partial [Pyrinomonadaceae bacterium]|nr:protein kinase [Pyrinomonadaceae bacterium]